MWKINKPNGFLLFCGAAVFLLLGAIAKISPRLSSGAFEKDLIPVFISLLIAASVVYFVAVGSFRKNRACSLLLIVLFGLGFRVLFLFSTPILENDYHRYFWDGAVVANGMNPYEYSPEEVAEGGGDEKLKELKRLYGDTLEKVNHPHVKTIYPPIAELFFAMSYKISSMSATAWRILLMVFDLITLGLLFASLKKLDIPRQYSIIYWWNPLLVKEIFNSLHMDVLAFPFVVGAVLLFLYGSKGFWALALSFAVGIKLWPALLFGMFLKPLKEKRQTLLQIFIFATAVLIMFLPMVVFKLDSTSGIVAYGKSWQNNSPFFAAILSGWEFILEAFDIHPGHAQAHSRVGLIAIFLVWKFYVAFANGSLGLHRKALLIVGGAFLLIPAQFPWYYTWLLPFLCIAPSPGFLALTALLPLYYLQYYFPLHPGEGGIFADAVIWIEFAPVWILLAWEWWRFRASKKASFSHTDISTG
jgi:hypothetical protein